MRYSALITFAAFLAMPIAGGCEKVQLTPSERDQLKAELMQEVMQTVYAQLAGHGFTGEKVETIRAKMKQEIEMEVLRKIQMLAPNTGVARAAAETQRLARGPVGVVEGLILRDGGGFSNCYVKLCRMVPTKTAGGRFLVYQENGEALHTKTAENGKCRFEAVPVGSYRLKWKLVGQRDWIRRLRDMPDVEIEAHKTTVLKSIETRRGLVSR